MHIKHFTCLSEIVIIFRRYKNFTLSADSAGFFHLMRKIISNIIAKNDVQRSDNQRRKILRYARTDSLKGAKFGVWIIGLTFFSLMNYDGGSIFYVDPCSMMVFSLSQCLHC